MLGDPRIQSRIQAHVAKRVVPTALEMLNDPEIVPRGKPRAATAASSAIPTAIRIGYAALALLLAAAAVSYGMPSAAPLTAVGSLVSGRAVVASVGGA